MTPREKAIELLNSYLQIYDGRLIKGKQCATIAVELAIEFCNGKDMSEEFEKILYLVEVKHEIEKL